MARTKRSRGSAAGKKKGGKSAAQEAHTANEEAPEEQEQLEGSGPEGSDAGEGEQGSEAKEEAPPSTAEPQPKKARTEAAGGDEAAEEGKGAATGQPKQKGQAKGEVQAEKEEQAGTKNGSGSGKKEGVVEEGRITFFYRPKVGVEEAGSLSEVQRFYMLMVPAQPGVKARLAVIGKKKLPAAAKHERFFGFIEASSDSVEDLTRDLGPEEHETGARGTRRGAAARAVGEGAYTITEHKGHTNLVFQLEVPSEPGEVQEALDIPKQGSYIFSVKNPANIGGPGQGLAPEQKAEYSEEKKEEFQGYAWIPVKDSQLLDYERCEFLLIGATEEPKTELGEAKAGAVEQVAQEQYGAESDEEELLQKLKEEIKAEEVGIDTEPAETGEWK